nr:unnamed protein product [Digitaria exilis]
MIVDFVNLSSDDDDDDDVVVAREEHSVHGQGHLIHAKAEFVDLTIDGDIVEGEHLSYGQGKAAQGTTFLKQKFIADDEQAEVVQCRATLRMEELTAGNAQAEAAQCTATLRMEEHIEGDGQGDAAWSTGVSHFLDGQNHLRIHPKFLHSNATSHKWAFGAIAELLDNAIDEVLIQTITLTIVLHCNYKVNNGATFVKIDKMKLSCDGDYALVIEDHLCICLWKLCTIYRVRILSLLLILLLFSIQDNGGGMSPESLRHCMSFGFSQKCTAASIGRYGNGFKTSTMRLGADAIVFTCTKDNRRLTRSVGLLSYTFLMTTKCNHIFVPTVDYEFDALSSTFQRIINCGEKHFSSNLSTLLRWCPFSTEGELLNQVCDVNLFMMRIGNSSNALSSAQDIMISGAPEIRAGRTVEKLTQMHVANRFRYSLRVYASMLYLHLPESFQIILCGQAVEPHYAVNDLIYRECIKYQPQVEVTTEVCSNQLDLVLLICGRVLEANFIRPTHDKQDFERTGLFQRLETRLKDMATEYWTDHCHLVGYTLTAKRTPQACYVWTTANHDDHNLVAQATTNTRNYSSRARASVALHPCSDGFTIRYPLHIDPDALTDQRECAASPSASINVDTTSYRPRNAPQQSQTELHKRRKPCLEMFWRAQKRRNTNLYSDQPGSDSGTEVGNAVIT